MGTYEEILKAIPKTKQKIAKRYIDELEWMDKKLAEARETIANSAVVIPYDNGGGQSGIRANPAYVEYEKLLKTWDKAMASLFALVPKETVSQDVNKKKSAESQIMVMHRKHSMQKSA